MARYAQVFGLIGIMIAVAGISSAADDAKDVFVRVVYTVNDLPVFKDTKNGKEFDATLLMAHIQNTVDPDSWMSTGKGDAEMQPFPKNKSLVVSQTQAIDPQII